MTYDEFLSLPQDKLIELCYGCKLRWYQRLYIKNMARWWCRMRDSSSLPPSTLMESILKGRF